MVQGGWGCARWAGWGARKMKCRLWTSDRPDLPTKQQTCRYCDGSWDAHKPSGNSLFVGSRQRGNGRFHVDWQISALSKEK